MRSRWTIDTPKICKTNSNTQLTKYTIIIDESEDFAWLIKF